MASGKPIDRKQASGSQSCGCGPSSSCGVNRRTFLRTTSAAAAGGTFGAAIVAGPFTPADTADHVVPADKKLARDWLRSLFERGQPTWYSGSDLEMIGMPVGGICAGQVYLTGDGRLVHWDIFNQRNFSGYGADNYQNFPSPDYPLKQGCAIQVETDDGQKQTRTLDYQGFPGVRFCGEYPIGTVEFADETFPAKITLTAFSPFIPLDAPDSALPCTLLRYRVANTGNAKITATLAGWLENGVACHTGNVLHGIRRNQVIRGHGATMVFGKAETAPAPTEPRPRRVLSDFEGDSYGDWQVEGEAFGPAPAEGTLPGQQEVSGYQGDKLVNTFLGGDEPHGRALSPEFTIDRSFISFLIGGGGDAERTCIRLLVDGEAVRSATGENNERLTWHNWDVRDLEGKTARIEIVDAASGPWGHINIDQIELGDQPRGAVSGPLEEQADYGTMALALLADDAQAAASVGDPAEVANVFSGLDEGKATGENTFPNRLCGALGQQLVLEPGESKEITFLVAWCFPNRPEHGNFYATRFEDAQAVVTYLAENHQRLVSATELWHDTWYDSTLPHWLLDRLFSTASTLATGTCQWWANGRFWAWEGVGCCHGTCAHVWNYEHTMARLFPSLERSVREMQDFNPQAGFDEQSGAIRFRGEGWQLWAGDSQGGTLLKAYREHQCSTDDSFLKSNWPRIRKALEFLFQEDKDANGLLEGSQHNTYDINFFGPNTMVGSLYLGACLAGEAMARELGDDDFAQRCRTVFERGRELTVNELFNGEYFIQQVDLEEHPDFQYADGCLSDQLFGQGWSHQVGLGYVYPEDTVVRTLQSIWKYNWTPDVGPYNELHAPERWFARAGDAGLFTCTWPKGGYGGGQPVRYSNEVWTGIEYQVAGHMAWEGLLTEALVICRGIHDRYHPSNHNPWNEVECGDHYARGMASHGVFLGLCGFEYHGPKRHLGFAPRFKPEDFRAAFTAAKGWGTIAQHRGSGSQVNTILVRWGKLELESLAFDVPEEAEQVSVQLGDRAIDAQMQRDGRRVVLTLPGQIALEEGDQLSVRFTA